MLMCYARMCVMRGEGQKADAVLRCAVLPTALSTDLSAKREEEKLISLRGPEGFTAVSQQTIMSQKWWSAFGHPKNVILGVLFIKNRIFFSVNIYFASNTHKTTITGGDKHSCLP